MPFFKIANRLQHTDYSKKKAVVTFSQKNVPSQSTIGKHGFTLIELLIAIAIVGILSTIGLYAFTSSQRRTRDTQRKNDLVQVKKALEAARNDCQAGGYYPVPVIGFGETVDFFILSGVLSLPQHKYLEAHIKDPINKDIPPSDIDNFNELMGYRYAYVQISSNLCSQISGTQAARNYILRAKLEIPNDPAAEKSRRDCSAKIDAIVNNAGTAGYFGSYGGGDYIPAPNDGFYYVCPD